MMEFHWISGIFPMMHPAEFEELAEDIKITGLLHPITRYQGKVLDGRNRERACAETGAEPRYTDYEGDDPLAFVLSMNMKRRHLDESQRAMVGMRVANMRQGARTDLKHPASLPEVSQSQAAKLVNVSERSLRDAVKVGSKGSNNLIRAVEDGKIAVSVAAKLAHQPEAVQNEAVDNPDRAATIVKQKTRQQHEADLATQIRDLPTKKFGVIYADPEWAFIPWSEETGNDRAASNHYAVSPLAAIKGRDVASISADHCVLFLWATVPLLEQAIDVLRTWGFEYKSHFIWLKDKAGTGYWSRNVHEILLIGTKGKPPAPAMGTQYESAWDAPVGAHSEKPDVVYELIETYFPNLPKIELNARKRRPGFDVWGAEAPLDLDAADEATHATTEGGRSGK